MIKTYWQPATGALIEGDQTLIEQWQTSSDSYIWVDVEHQQLSNQAVKSLLAQFNCNPLVVSDVMRKRHPPKIELFEDQLFILYRGISKVISNLEFEHQQIGFFIGERFLITVHPNNSLGISNTLTKKQFPELVRNPLRLALTMIHTSSETYLQNLLGFEDELSNQEDALKGGEKEVHLTALAGSRTDLLRLKRIFNYHQQMLSDLLAVEEHPLLASPEELPHINNVFERFERLHSLSCLFYELCSDMVEGYISISAHQQNISMRVLTVVMSIFVPLSFLAGLYGMNFEHIPELHFKHGYFVLLGVMAIVGTTLLVMFKRKQWF